MAYLTLKATRKNAFDNVVCWSRLLQIIAQNYWRIKYGSKQHGHRTDCSCRSSLIWVHTVCHRVFLNISADEKCRRLAISALRVKFRLVSFISAIVFVYDFFPGAETLLARHFSQASSQINGFSSPFTMEGSARPFSAGKGKWARSWDFGIKYHYNGNFRFVAPPVL